ncbi:hypothetical protein HZB90_01150 [archaeon]|nr:hypothetical protein [archaeon]
MLRVLDEKFPEWIDHERCRKLVEGTGKHDSEIRLWVRYTGNVVLKNEGLPGSIGYDHRDIWMRAEAGKLIAIRDYITSMGFTPKLDTAVSPELGLNPHASKLMYSFPVGTRIVIDKVNKKKKVVREMPLEDRVYIGFSRFTCEGRCDNR